MLAAYVCAIVLVVASALVGRAIFVGLGRERTTWLEPVTGFAVLCVVASGGARLLDSGAAAALACGALAVAALVVLRGRVVEAPALRLGLPVAVAAVAVASLPFLASDRLGILGVGVNNDLASHLLWADWLQQQPHPIPVGVANGYPVGPHSLMAALGVTFGFNMTEAVVGLLLALACLTALTSLAALCELAAWQRVGGAVLVALAYPVASALAVGGFKENVMALFLLGFALGLWRLERDWPGDRATLVALGLIPAGIISSYSFQGLYWAIAAAGLLAVAGGVRALRAGSLGREIRRAVPVVGLPTAVFVVLACTELLRARTFQDVSGVRVVISSNSKLRQEVSPFEALGSWPSSHFLTGAPGLDGSVLFAALGGLALVLGLAWWLRRGQLALPLALLGAFVIYLGTLAQAGFYVQSKALLVPGALAMLVILRGLAGDTGPEAAPQRGRSRIPSPPRWLAAGTAAIFVAVAAASSFLALRDATVAAPEHADELRALGGETGDDWVLSLSSDRFTDYFLGSTSVVSPSRNAQQPVRSRAGKDYRLPLDFDSVDNGVLDSLDWVVTTRAAYRSRPPANLELVRTTPSFELWRRVGPTPPNVRVFGEEARPGKVLNCRRQDIAEGEKRRVGVSATVMEPPPAIGKRLDWNPASELAPGESASQTLELGAGTWDLSLQYQSPLVGLRVEAAGLDRRLPPAMDGAIPYRFGQGPFWSAGSISTDGGPVELTVSAEDASALQNLLGVDAEAALGNIVAVRRGSSRVIGFAAACGRYVDHYTVSPGSVRAKRPITLPPRPLPGIAGQG